MGVELKGNQSTVLALLLVAVFYFLFVHENIDFGFLPWNHRIGKQTWDELIAHQASEPFQNSTSDFREAHVFAGTAEGAVLRPPRQDEQLASWVQENRAHQETKPLSVSGGSTWEEEAIFFIELRRKQEATWLENERRLNSLYGWFNGFYNAMLSSKQAANSMHDAPSPQPTAPAEEAPDRGGTQAFAAERRAEEAPAADPPPGSNALNDTSKLLAAASQLSTRIQAEQESISFVKGRIREFQAAHKEQLQSLGDARRTQLARCERGAERRRMLFIELHGFMDIVFQRLSEDLEAARIAALRIRNSPSDNRTATQETSEVQELLDQRDPRITQALAKVLDEARVRERTLAELKASVELLQQQARDADGLMESMHRIEADLVETFQGFFRSENALEHATELLRRCSVDLEAFQEDFEVTLKQKDVATEIVHLASTLDGVSSALHPAAKATLEGLAVQLQELGTLDERVRSQAAVFKELITSESLLASEADVVKSFSDTCEKMVGGLDLAISSGRAKMMQYYAAHHIYKETADGIPAELKHLEGGQPPKPRARKVDYAYQASAASAGRRPWWRGSPPPPPLPAYLEPASG
mmetsp:Transcript_28852/g.68934  ORF Transcript_28852/g.68934 Transcript_28852/m.68934 type:complete len:588 (+) Transcript_28852:236-1999(+)